MPEHGSEDGQYTFKLLDGERQGQEIKVSTHQIQQKTPVPGTWTTIWSHKWKFATLTEVPILQGLIGAGMGKGPALALLLAGPALSLPNMLVIRSVMGTQKTVVFVCLVIVMATLSGVIFGMI